jgi:hypothetical protein
MEPRDEYVNKKELVGSLLAQCNQTRKKMIETTVLRDIPVSIDHWPAKEIAKFLGSHVGFNERLSLSYFLFGNGMTPGTLEKWCTAEPGYLAHQHSARHMASIITSYGNGDFDGKTYWDVQWDELRKLKAPPFAKETHTARMKCYDFDDDGHPVGLPYWDVLTPGCKYFENAAKELHRYSLKLRVKEGGSSSAPFVPKPHKMARKGAHVFDAPDAATAAKWIDEAEVEARKMLKIKRCGPLGASS